MWVIPIAFYSWVLSLRIMIFTYCYLTWRRDEEGREGDIHMPYIPTYLPHAPRHTHIHTFTHTYTMCTHTHTYIHTYIHTHTYLPTYLPAYMHACIHTYIHVLLYHVSATYPENERKMTSPTSVGATIPDNLCYFSSSTNQAR